MGVLVFSVFGVFRSGECGEGRETTYHKLPIAYET